MSKIKQLWKMAVGSLEREECGPGAIQEGDHLITYSVDYKQFAAVVNGFKDENRQIALDLLTCVLYYVRIPSESISCTRRISALDRGDTSSPIMARLASGARTTPIGPILPLDPLFSDTAVAGSKRIRNRLGRPGMGRGSSGWPRARYLTRTPKGFMFGVSEKTVSFARVYRH